MSKLDDLRFEILSKISSVIFPKYRFKWHHLDWWNNRKFNEFLSDSGIYKNFNDDRIWMLSQICRMVRDVPGDTAECGVYKGASSKVICNDNHNSEFMKVHHIFDSFEGLSQPGDQDGKHWAKGDLFCSEEEVKRNLASFDNVKFYKGWIPERFFEVKDARFSLVHIDVDLCQPTRDSFEFFYPRMAHGGIIVCDDYGLYTCPGVREAIDVFLSDKPEKMIEMCSGGGFMIKGMKTGSALYW